MKKSNLAKLKRMEDRLRKGCKTKKPVEVTYEPMRSLYGWCDDTDDLKGYVIAISTSYGYECAVDTLMHEWAHAMYPRGQHGSGWGKAFAKAYRCAYRTP
jgi:hypothetical protein